MKIYGAMFALLVGTAAVAQTTVPAIGHAGQIVSVGGGGATPRYVECLNACTLAAPSPDASTLAALHYTETNMLGGMRYNSTLGYKTADVCVVSYSSPTESVCRTYISGPVLNISQTAGSWQAETMYNGQNWVFLSWDLCMNYYPHNNSVSARLHWPEECSTYPEATKSLPPPPTYFKTGVGVSWTCTQAEGPAGWDGFMSCSKG